MLAGGGRGTHPGAHGCHAPMCLCSYAPRSCPTSHYSPQQWGLFPMPPPGSLLGSLVLGSYLEVKMGTQVGNSSVLFLTVRCGFHRCQGVTCLRILLTTPFIGGEFPAGEIPREEKPQEVITGKWQWSRESRCSCHFCPACIY